MTAIEVIYGNPIWTTLWLGMFVYSLGTVIAIIESRREKSK